MANYFLILLLGLCLIFTAGVFAVSYVLIQEQKFYSFCRKGVIDGQKTLLLGLKHLMKLNPKATRLRKERTKAQNLKRLALQGGPISVAAAETYLQSVIARQLALKIKQQAIIASTNLKAQSLLFAAKRQFLTHATNFAGYVYPALLSPLLVRAIPTNSLTPNYYPERTIEQRQKIQVKWRWAPLGAIEEYIEDFKIKNLIGWTQCQSLPKKENAQWRVTWKEAKFL